MSYHTIIPDETWAGIRSYLSSLREEKIIPGKYLAEGLSNHSITEITDHDFLDLLLNTKEPVIFAEMAVSGNGTDWNLTELKLLGDISIAVEVTIFDDGKHDIPKHHAHPFSGTLVYTPGALLRSGGGTPADWDEVTDDGGSLDKSAYFQLYERRLLPVFQFIDGKAALTGKPALITIPGLGCGQFAGPFRGKLGAFLDDALEQLLEKHSPSFQNIRVVYYDPFNECSNKRREINGISLMTRPLVRGNQNKPQLCPPITYAEAGDDFSGLELYSIVAWDHVSWPGNDFYGGSRSTDDGVKAAATDSMSKLTGITGKYSRKHDAYLPPSPFRNWEHVITEMKLRLKVSIPVNNLTS